MGLSERYKDTILDIIEQYRSFKTCGPSDDPDLQTIVIYSMRDIVRKIKYYGKKIVSERLTSELCSINEEIDKIYEVYDTISKLEPIVDDMEELVKEMNEENDTKENNMLKPIEKVQLIEKIAYQLQQQMSTSDINMLLLEYGIEFVPENMANSKRIYVKNILSKVESKVVLRIAEDIGIVEKSNLVEVEELNKIDFSYINEQIVKCNSKINSGDYDGAITNARTLIESVCIFILDESGTSYDNEGSLIKLYKLVANSLNMNPQSHENDSLKQICSGFFSIINGLATMRNSLSDAHGKGISNRYKPEKRHAVVAVNSSKTISEYLLSSWKSK